MNGNAQKPRNDGQEDLLGQIISQGLEKMKTPARAETGPEPSGPKASPAPQPENGGDASVSAERKNRQSAVYLYLLVLFGAAFLMLLLAYFVQQRSSESAISDLNDSMNLSREELLEEIRALETENETLSGELDRLSGELSQWEGYREESMESIDLWRQLYEDALKEVHAWSSFWELERYYQAEDYENCAAVLLLQSQAQFSYRTPEPVQERYGEIVQAVIDAGVLAEDYSARVSDYEELIGDYLTEHPVLYGTVGC